MTLEAFECVTVAVQVYEKSKWSFVINGREERKLHHKNAEDLTLQKEGRKKEEIQKKRKIKTDASKVSN